MDTFSCPICGADIGRTLDTMQFRCTSASCGWAGRIMLPHTDDTLIIASLDSYPVVAHRMPLEEQPGQAVIAHLSLIWQGEQLLSDGAWTALPTNGGNELSSAQYTWLKLAIQAQIVDRLIALTKIYCDRPWPLMARAVAQHEGS